MTEPGVIKALVHTLDGRYLAREGTAWTFTRDCSAAALFDFPAPAFEEQLEGFAGAFGSIFVAVPFDALKAYEICDQCGRMVNPLKAFFDGTHFVCPQCSLDPARLEPATALKADSSWPSRN